MTFQQRKILKVKKSLNDLFEGLKKILQVDFELPQTEQEITNRFYLIKLEPNVANLVQRSAYLFFFYQVSDPFQSLQMHDYGFYEYEQFLNYLTHGKNFKTVGLKDNPSQNSQPEAA